MRCSSLAARADLDARCPRRERARSKTISASGARRSGQARRSRAPKARRSSSGASCSAGRAANTPDRRSQRTSVARVTVEDVVARFAAGRDDDDRDDARGARAELARSRRADDGARRSVSHDARRNGAGQAQDDRGVERSSWVPGRSAGPGFRGSRFGFVRPKFELAARTLEVRARPDADQLSVAGIDRGPSWFLRRISLPTWILPLGRPFMTMQVDGLEHLAALDGPVDLRRQPSKPHGHAGDHARAAGELALLARAGDGQGVLPRAFLSRQHSAGSEWFTNSLNYYLSLVEFFNAFPLPQREAGTRQTLRYIGEVLADGYSMLIFPEGKRTRTGEMAPFRPGIGMIGARLDVPVVPVRLDGLDKVLASQVKWPQRGPVARRVWRPAAAHRRGLPGPGETGRGGREEPLKAGSRLAAGLHRSGNRYPGTAGTS